MPALTACRHTVSGSISLPSRGAFHLSLTVLLRYQSPNVFSLTRWSSRIHPGFLVSRATRDTTTKINPFRLRDFHPLRSIFPDRFVYKFIPDLAVPLPRLKGGLGSSPFVRHYWGNHCYFLFLALLRCFSSRRLLPCG